MMLGDRATVTGQLILSDTAPTPTIGAATIVGNTIRQVPNLDSRTIWRFTWPTANTVSSSEGSVELQPDTDYGTVFVRDQHVLSINKSGTYFIRDLTLDSGGKIQVANDAVVRLAIANIPVLHGDVVLADQNNTAAPKFLMAVLSSGSVTVGGAFQGLFLAPSSDVIVTGWGNHDAPLPHRGAFWGSTVELHQGGAMIQGVDPILFVNPSVVGDDSSDPASGLVRYVPAVGYLDGTDCDHWPRALKREDVLDSVLTNAPTVSSDSLTQLKTALKETLRVDSLVSIGSSRSLSLASYIGTIAPDGTPTRYWVAVDEQAGIGYDLSQEFLCSEKDVFDSVSTPTCKRQKVTLNFGDSEEQIQVLRRVNARDSAVAPLTAVLVAPQIKLMAPPDGYPQNTVKLDINLILASGDILGVASNRTPVKLDVKPYIPTGINNPTALFAALHAMPRQGVVAVFADKIKNVSVISTHTSIEVAKYTPLEGMDSGEYRPLIVSPSSGAPTSDESIYSEYLFPKSWLLEYHCNSPYTSPLNETVTSPPDYFCNQWQNAQLQPSSTYATCNYSTASGTTAWGVCGKLFCDGTVKNGVNKYRLSFNSKTTFQNITCLATAHTGLLDRRSSPAPGGWAILAAGTGSDSVDVRAPQGEVVKFDSAALRRAISSTSPLITSDAWRALVASRAFYSPASSPSNGPFFWGNPTDLSVPAFNPTVRRCSIGITAFTLGYGADVKMTCGAVNSPFLLSMGTTGSVTSLDPRFTHYEVQMGERTLPTAAVAINSNTTAYLLDVLDGSRGVEIKNYEQVTVKQADSVAANTGAQVVTGGDFYQTLNHWATTAAKAADTPIPGREFQQLRSIVNNMTPLVVNELSSNVALNAIELTTAEKNRIVAFGDQSDIMQGLAPADRDFWLTDITGTPYGKVLTGWKPQWFTSSSPDTLNQAKVAWNDTAVVRTTDFYDTYNRTTSGFDYGFLASTVSSLMGAISENASTAADNAKAAAPSQTQALETLQNTIVSVQANRKTLHDTIRTILKLEVTADDSAVSNAIAGLVATSLAQCSARHTPSDPFFSAISSIAKFVPYVSQAATILGEFDDALAAVNTCDGYIKNFNRDGTFNYIDTWLDMTQPLVKFAKKVSDYMGTATDVISAAQTVSKALEDYQGNCPTTDDSSLLAKNTLMNLAEQQSLAQAMQDELGTIVGAIQAITGNAQYYIATSSTSGALAADASRLATQLSDAQVISRLKNRDWTAQRQAVLASCAAAHTAIEARLPVLTQLSRSLATTAGRASTAPGVMIPAWDDAADSHQDTTIPLPYNLWNPNHQFLVTGTVKAPSTSDGPVTAKKAIMSEIWDRWLASKQKICNITFNSGAYGNLVFNFKKDILGTTTTSKDTSGKLVTVTHPDLANFLKNGVYDFAVDFADWLSASSVDINISPTVWRNTSTAWAALVSSPVVWKVAYQACTGTDDDPCCDKTTAICTTPLVTPDSASIAIVRLPAAWTPTYDVACGADSTAFTTNPNYASNPRPALFPVATQACKSTVTVPAVYQAIDNTATKRSSWAQENVNEICASTGVDVWSFTPFRGLPLFGSWSLVSGLDNAAIVARHATDTTPLTVPSASLASSNADVKAIRIMFSVIAEPTASQGPVSYSLLSQGLPATGYTTLAGTK
jgi:hypothetical protein